MILIIGLGNPGTHYKYTRHNAGFFIIDQITGRFKNLKETSRFDSNIAKVELESKEVFFIKPQTFMNRSGIPVSKIYRKFKYDVRSMLVIHDEIDLPLGTIRYKSGGGSGGHNGLRSIMDNI